MPTWEDIQSWTGTGLDSVVDGIISERVTAMAVEDAIASIDVTSGWRGAGADAAKEALEDLKSKCAEHLRLVENLLEMTSRAQNGVRGVETKVLEATSFASANELSISSDGTVTDVKPPPVFIVPIVLAIYEQERKRLVEECARVVSDALTKAQDVDTDYTEALNRLL